MSCGTSTYDGLTFLNVAGTDSYGVRLDLENGVANIFPHDKEMYNTEVVKFRENEEEKFFRSENERAKMLVDPVRYIHGDQVFDCSKPFRDYPSDFLSKYSPRDALNFMLDYTKKYIKHSLNINKLNNEKGTQHHHSTAKANVINDISGIRTTPATSFRLSGRESNASKRNVLKYHTDLSMKYGIGDCQAHCFAIARGLKEFGFPGKISAVMFQGILSDGRRVDHMIIKVSDKNGGGICIGDPLIHRLSDEQKKRILGRVDVPSCWVEGKQEKLTNWNKFGYVYVEKYNDQGFLQRSEFIPFSDKNITNGRRAGEILVHEEDIS